MKKWCNVHKQYLPFNYATGKCDFCEADKISKKELKKVEK